MKSKYIYLALIWLTLGSCSDVLDVAPDGRKSLDEIFGSEQTTGGYLNGCYQNFPQFALNSYFWSNTAVALSDNAWEYHTVQTSFVYAYKGSIDATHANNLLIRDMVAGYDFNPLNSWDLYFRNIRRCNVFLSRIGTAAVPSETERARWTAEAKTLRAYYYMELLGRFGSVPIMKEVFPLDFDPSALSRGTFKDCVDQVIKDCDEAAKEPAFPWRITVASEQFRMTKAVAMGIKSRLILFAASPLWNGGENYWAEAERITKEALDECLANDYALYSVTTNKNIFGENAYFELNCTKTDISATPNDKETILASKAAMNNWWNVQGTPITNAAKSGLCPTQELVDSYPMADGTYVLNLEQPYLDERHLQPNFAASSTYNKNQPYENRDPRFYATILYNGTKVKDNTGTFKDLYTHSGGNGGLIMANGKRTCTGYYPRKHYHPDTYNGKQTPSTWRIIRLAELYLNYAEAANENGHTADAVTHGIMPIRNRVKMPNINPKNQDEARLMIANERRVEMAFEDTRYYDMRRWTKPTDNMPTGRYLTGMWIEKVGTTYEYHRFQIGDTYNKTTKTWAGTGWERACYVNKYLLHPIELTEANRLEGATGVRWQNPGW